MVIDAHEFVDVMTPPLFRAAALASGTVNSAVSQKAHENLPGSETEVDRASRVDILSEVDLRIQELLLSVVFEHWPFVCVLAEEETSTKAKFAKSSAFCVLIDPVDGTSNYLKRDPRYCHIVSLTHREQMIVTLLYSHAARQLFVAIKGQGTRVVSADNQSTQIYLPSALSNNFFHHVSRIPEAVLQDIGFAGFRPTISTQNASDILTLLNGEANGFISYAPLVYDVWSPGMIVQEAGGWVSDWYGRPLIFRGQARLPHVLIAVSHDVVASFIMKLTSRI